MQATVLTEGVNQKLAARKALPDPSVRRALRLAAGLTLQDIAHEVGVSAEAVRLWESGRRRPGGANLIAYVALLSHLRVALGREEVS